MFQLIHAKCSGWYAYAWRQVSEGDAREIKKYWSTYRRALVVSTILLRRIALLRRVAAAVARKENKSISVFLQCIP